MIWKGTVEISVLIVRLHEKKMRFLLLYVHPIAKYSRTSAFSILKDNTTTPKNMSSFLQLEGARNRFKHVALPFPLSWAFISVWSLKFASCLMHIKLFCRTRKGTGDWWKTEPKEKAPRICDQSSQSMKSEHCPLLKVPKFKVIALGLHFKEHSYASSVGCPS